MEGRSGYTNLVYVKLIYFICWDAGKFYHLLALPLKIMCMRRLYSATLLGGSYWPSCSEKHRGCGSHHGAPRNAGGDGRGRIGTGGKGRGRRGRRAHADLIAVGCHVLGVGV